MTPRYDDKGEQIYICSLCADSGVVWWPPYTQPGRASSCPECHAIRHTFDYSLARYRLWLKREKHAMNRGQAAAYLLYNQYRDEILATEQQARRATAVQLSLF